MLVQRHDVRAVNRGAEPSTPKASTRGGGWKPALWILGAALLTAAPWMLGGCSCGHDFNFHLLSWMEAARAWRTGVWYPHWVHDANFGAGEPRLLFYPPASWMLGGLFGSITSWPVAPALFVLLVLLGCGWSMYLLAREWLPIEASILAACFYIANPYGLFVIYERSAFGEMLASIWLPLVVLFALKRRSSVAALGLAVAAVWLSDLPAAIMASYILAMLALGMALAERKAWPVLRAVGGMTVGLGLAAFYIFPVGFERSWIESMRALEPALRFQDNYLFKRTADSYHNQVLGTASSIVLFEIAAAGIAAWLLLRKKAWSSASIAVACLLPLILFLQFPASEVIWNRAPFLRFLQFPWRWLLFVSVAACLLVALATGPPEPIQLAKRRRPWWRRRLATGVAVFAMALAGTLLFFQPCDDEDTAAAQVAAFRTGQGVEGTDEYTRFGADNSEIQQGLPLVRVLRGAEDDVANSDRTENPAWRPKTVASIPASVSVKRWNSEHWSIRVESGAAGYAVLRLMDYPAWRVTLNNQAIQRRPMRDDGLMAVPVIAGSNAIDVRWRATSDVIAGRAVSAAALLVLILLGLGEHRGRPEGQEEPANRQV